jgi:hypothetical protein
MMCFASVELHEQAPQQKHLAAHSRLSDSGHSAEGWDDNNNNKKNNNSYNNKNNNSTNNKNNKNNESYNKNIISGGTYTFGTGSNGYSFASSMTGTVNADCTSAVSCCHAPYADSTHSTDSVYTELTRAKPCTL